MVKQATQTKGAETNLRTSPNDTVFWLKGVNQTYKDTGRWSHTDKRRSIAETDYATTTNTNEHEYILTKRVQRKSKGQPNR